MSSGFFESRSSARRIGRKRERESRKTASRFQFHVFHFSVLTHKRTERQQRLAAPVESLDLYLWISHGGEPRLKDWDGVKHNRWVLDKVLDRRENCNAEEEGSVGIDCDSPLTTWTLAPWYGDPAPPVYASLLEFKIPAESMYASSGKSSPTDLKMGSVVLTEYGQTLTNTQGPYDPAEKVVFLSPLSVRRLSACGALDASP